MDAKNLLSPDPIRESGDVLSAWLNMNYYLLLSNCQALPESPEMDVDATYSKGCDRYVIERRELQVFWIYDSRVWVSYDHAHLARWRSEYFSRKIVCRTGCLLRWSATSLGSRSAWAPVFYLAVHTKHASTLGEFSMLHAMIRNVGCLNHYYDSTRTTSSATITGRYHDIYTTLLVLGGHSNCAH